MVAGWLSTGCAFYDHELKVIIDGIYDIDKACTIVRRTISTRSNFDECYFNELKDKLLSGKKIHPSLIASWGGDVVKYSAVEVVKFGVEQSDVYLYAFFDPLDPYGKISLIQSCVASPGSQFANLLDCEPGSSKYYRWYRG